MSLLIIFYVIISTLLGFFVNRPIDTKLPEEVYDIDTEAEDEHEPHTKVDIGTKEGYLLKGPEIGSDRIFSNLASKSFKKRFCSMVREADGAYILEVYKDDKKIDTKLTIVMDFCSEVVKVSEYKIIVYNNNNLSIFKYDFFYKSYYLSTNTYYLYLSENVPFTFSFLYRKLNI